MEFFDSGGNLILSAPFQTIQQSGTVRVHTLVGDDGTFLTTPGVSLPYSPLDLTNDKLEIIPFGMTAGNVAPFSTNNGAFNTFVSGSSAVFKCGN